MSTALERFCKKLHEQELERKRRKECGNPMKKEEPKKKICKRRLDKRLDNWQYYLRARKRITLRIMKRTGKSPKEILLNCSTSTEKAMIQRLLDQADRLSPENQWRKERVLTTFTKCGLNVSLPDNNKLRKAFTVYGLPQVSKTESFCLCCSPQWFKSKLITQRFEEKKIDIYNLITHFPEVECLQIVGKAMKLHDPSELKKQQKKQATQSESLESAGSGENEVK